MCQGRLAAGEAPACVQACPGGAITIRLVDKQAVPRAGNIVAGAFESSYTGPTTRYVSQCGVSVDLEADDEATRPLDDPHYPLVVMLVFTQAAAGGFVAACFFDGHLRVLSTILCFVGLIASFLHLGQPLKAVRAVLGWRKSWLSREIIVLSLFAKLAVVSFLFPQITPIAAVVGLLGVFASIMVYVDTKRPRWAMQHTGVEFGVTTVVAGLGIAALPLGWPFAFAAGIIGFVFGNRLCLLQSFTAFFPPLSLALGLGACLVQRTHFFTHARGGKMPAN